MKETGRQFTILNSWRHKTPEPNGP